MEKLELVEYLTPWLWKVFFLSLFMYLRMMGRFTSQKNLKPSLYWSTSVGTHVRVTRTGARQNHFQEKLEIFNLKVSGDLRLDASAWCWAELQWILPSQNQWRNLVKGFPKESATHSDMFSERSNRQTMKKEMAKGYSELPELLPAPVLFILKKNDSIRGKSDL